MAANNDVPQELKPWFKIFDQLCRRHDYITVFDDYLMMLLNWFANAEFKEQWFDRKRRYDEKELMLFNELYRELILMFQKEIDAGVKWYDPFGQLYQALSSRGKASKLGQFFTPESLCDMIAQMNIDKERIEQLVGDPACGSGRMLLAAHSVNRTNHYVAQDLDKMCCMMTAINMALHCMSGVVIHGNTLSMENYAYWAISRVEVQENVFLPKINIITKEQYEEWHKKQLFISKWINPQRKTEFDETKTAEIIEKTLAPICSISADETAQQNDHADQLLYVEAVEPVTVRKERKPKLIINPDSQLTLFD